MNSKQRYLTKSWSYDDEFFTRSGTIQSGWIPYLYDVAFQYWVMSRAHPKWNITPTLMLVNKDAVTTVDGLYQRFRVVENENGRKEIKLKPSPDTGRCLDGPTHRLIMVGVFASTNQNKLSIHYEP